MSYYDNPHKPVKQTSGCNGTYSDYYPKLCECGRTMGHPIHMKKFRNKPTIYQIYMESKK